MYLCYLDESGTPDIPGNTSHYVLAGLAIPVQYWKECDHAIENIKQRYGLANKEIHVAWMMRSYLEQSKIADFDRLDYAQRRFQVTALRHAELFAPATAGNPSLYHQTRKNYQKTDDYVHLSYQERRNLLRDVAATLSGWGYARLFAECVDKLYFDPSRT